MNKQRRTKLKGIVADISRIMNNIESVKDDEQESLDSLPDSLADSSRASEMENNIDLLEEACSGLEDAASIINDVIG